MRIFVFMLFLVFSAQLQAKKAQQDPEKLAPTHGYAYVFFPKGTAGALTVKSQKDGREYTLAIRNDPGMKAYGLWLPEGKYTVSRWGQYSWGEYPEFEVQAGRITDMGGLMPVNIGGYEIVVLPMNHAETAREIDMAINEISIHLKSREPIQWRPATPPKPIKLTQPLSGLGLVADLLLAHDRKVNKPSFVTQLKSATTNEEFFKINKAVTPPMYVEAAVDNASDLYFGADLGQMRVRHADGTWGNIGIDTLHTISAVEFSDNALYAGSDNGHLRVSKDSGANWALLKSFGEDEAIIDIDYEAGVWVVATARQIVSANGVATSDRISVYVSKHDDFSDIVKSRDFVLTQKNFIGWFGAHGQLAKGAYYISTMLELNRLDLRTEEWKAITPPANVSKFHIDTESGILSSVLSKGMFSKIFISNDQGDTWKQVGRPPYIIMDVAFDNSEKGYASRWNMNAFSGDWEIYSYDKSLDDWKKTSEAPFNCRPLRVSPKFPLLCITNGASIFSQQGSDWAVEFSAQ